MISLFLAFLRIARSEDAEFCIYVENKDLCKGYGKAFASKKYAKEMKNISSQTNKFDGYDSVTISIAEDIPKITIDLYLTKNAVKVSVIGLNVEERISYILGVSDVATLGTVVLRNAHCIKDKTTEFFITELTISNVVFTGFEKASCFYGGMLDIDLLSPSNTSFKFDSVIYRINQTKSFFPNYKVDGAIFTKSVVFMDFLENSSIFQYGNQFIITPVSTEMGFRRTNFRASSSENITYRIENNRPGSLLTLGCWFSNRVSSFTDIVVHAVDSNVAVQGRKWHGYEKLNFILENSTLTINETNIHVDIMKGSRDSSIELLVNYDFDDINTNNFTNIKFVGSKLSLKTLTLNQDKGIDLTADFTEIQKVTSSSKNTEANISGSAVIIHSVSSYIKQLNVNELILPEKMTIEFDQNSIPYITAKKAVVQSEICQLNLSKDASVPFPEITSEFTSLITTDSDVNIDTIIDEGTFPIKMTHKDNQYGFTLADLIKQRTHSYCISPDGTSLCGFQEGKVVNSSATNLMDMFKDSDVKEDHFNMVHVTIYLDTDEKFTLSSPSLFESVAVYGYNGKGSVYDETPENIKYLIAENVTLEINSVPVSPKVQYIKAFKCTLGDFFRKNLDFYNVNYASFDNETYGQFAAPVSPHNLVIKVSEIHFQKSWISPAFPLNIPDRSITVTDVEIVSGHNGFKENLTLIVQPREKINFTTNSYGTLAFKLKATKKCDVYFKAVLPVDCFDKTGTTEYVLHPNFYGSNIESKNKLCSFLVNLDLQEKEYISLGDSSLYCPGFTKPSVLTEISMGSPYIRGVVEMNKLKIDRQLYLDNDTYFKVGEFANPDDDFLVYFNWTLDRMPYMIINRFSNAHVSTFSPSMQTYVYPSDDDDFIHEHSKIFNMGIPFLCIEDSDFKGNIFHDGLIFKLQNYNITVSTVNYRIGEERETDVCAYVIPYTPDPPKKPKKGPANPIPWYIIPSVSFVILLILGISLAISYLKPKKSIDGTDLTMNILADQE